MGCVIHQSIIVITEPIDRTIDDVSSHNCCRGSSRREEFCARQRPSFVCGARRRRVHRWQVATDTYRGLFDL